VPSILLAILGLGEIGGGSDVSHAAALTSLCLLGDYTRYALLGAAARTSVKAPHLLIVCSLFCALIPRLGMRVAFDWDQMEQSLQRRVAANVKVWS
jgi:hypothetical protein